VSRPYYQISILKRGTNEAAMKIHFSCSNDEIYDGELVTFPDSGHLSARMAGIDFNLVSDGVDDRGTYQTNMIEATAVAAALVQYLKDGTGRLRRGDRFQPRPGNGNYQRG